ncbi:MAG: hypothetical protein K2K56_10120 [Lachnospiraceae bacterium]|nr:hypothetical protein [Lachnospiraceae bacterium]
MNKEKKVVIIMLLVYLSIVCVFLYFDVGDFVKYKMHSEEYQVLKVKIIDTNISSASHSKDIGIFNYYDNGEKRTGRISLNHNEREGDYIDIAFDEKMNYIRTQIIVSKKELWEWVRIIFFGIIILYEGYKVFKKE